MGKKFRWPIAGAIVAAAIIFSYAATAEETLASAENSSIESGFAGNDWGSDYCPNALPADENPYERLVKKYAQRGQDAKLEWAGDKMDHYQACAQNSRGAASLALNANKTHQYALKIDDQATAKATTKPAALKSALAGEGIFLSEVFIKSFDLAYADPGNAPAPAAVEAIMRKTFCGCLSHSTESFLKEEEGAY